MSESLSCSSIERRRSTLLVRDVPGTNIPLPTTPSSFAISPCSWSGAADDERVERRHALAFSVADERIDIDLHDIGRSQHQPPDERDGPRDGRHIDAPRATKIAEELC